MKSDRSSSQKHDIFISYRKESGIDLACRVKEYLDRKNYSAFMDIDGLRAGPFNTQLFFEIEESIDFIIILTKNCLERCGDENDWFGKELAHALKLKKNIIPIYSAVFEMPPIDDLPVYLKSLPQLQGLKLYNDLFSEKMKELENRFLSSKPRKRTLKVYKKTIIQIIVILLIIILSIGSYYINNNYCGLNFIQKVKKSLGINNTTSEWQLFSSETGGFSVMVPKNPEETSKYVNPGIDNSKLFVFQISIDNTTAYFVNYYDLKETPPNAKALIDSRAGEFVSAAVNSGGRLRDQTILSLDGNPGKEVIIDLSNGVTMRQRFYLVGKREYFLTVRGLIQDEKCLSEGFEKFFKSFKLLLEKKDVTNQTPKTILTTGMTHRLDSVYRSIRRQHELYLRLNVLAGQERIKVANEIVTGYQKLMTDLDFFNHNAPPNDPRRDTVRILLNYLQKRGSK